MMNKSQTPGNLLFQTVKKIAECLGCGQAVYSYRRDFTSLWQACLDNTGPSLYIVIMDGWPADSGGPIDYKRWLSPTDWAVMLRIRRDRALKIALLDPQLMSDANSTGARFLNQIDQGKAAQSIWLKRLVWPGKHPVAPDADLSQFMNFIHTPAPAIDPEESQILQRYWKSLIADPVYHGDHHSISNVMAPLVLARPNITNPYIIALQTLLSTLELMPSKATFSNVDWLTPELQEKIAHTLPSKRCQLNLLIVDDQLHQQGWGLVLQQNLGLTSTKNPEHPFQLGRRINPDLTLNGLDDPQPLLDWLEQNLASPATVLDWSWLGGNFTNEILLLDLRLFPNQPKQEGEFFARLVTLANTLQQRKTLTWPGFNEQELAATSQIGEKLQQLDTDCLESPDYHVALTLLPRLIAQADPTLPIILFSSTGRRAIIERLKGYGTIITRFEKPRFFETAIDDIAEQTADKFQQALTEALDWLNVRHLARKLSHIDTAIRPRFFTQPSSFAQPYTAELYIDETGSENSNTMTVGGMLLIMPPEVDSLSLEEAVFGHEVRDKAQDRQNRATLAEKLVDTARQKGIFCAAVAVAGETQKKLHSEQSSIFELEIEVDNLHRTLTRQLIECGIYQLARSLIPDAGFLAYEINSATRVKHVNADQAKQYNRVWGIGSKHIPENQENRQYRVYLSRYDTPRALLERLLDHYPSQASQIRPIAARGFGINETNKDDELKPRQFHYFADALLDNANRFVGKIPAEEHEEGLCTLWQNGFVTRYGFGLNNLLTAQRLLNHSPPLVAEALLAIDRNQSLSNFSANDIRAHLLAQMQQLCSTLCSDELMQLKQYQCAKQLAKLAPANIEAAARPIPGADAAMANQDTPSVKRLGKVNSKSLRLEVIADDGQIYTGRVDCTGGTRVKKDDAVCFWLDCQNRITQIEPTPQPRAAHGQDNLEKPY